MKVKIQKVDGWHQDTIPEENETIEDSIYLDELMTVLKSVSFYLRPARDCPFGRGNWVVDLTLKDDNIICIKYPIEMTDTELRRFLKPLLDRLISHESNKDLN
jgi:hypothetical protein